MKRKLLKTKAEIEKWLSTYNIINYDINSDLTLYIGDNVTLNDYDGEYLPVQFKDVSGKFSILQGKKLKSLEGCPEYVGGYFEIRGCTKLKNFIGCSEKVGGDFICHKCDNLVSILGLPDVKGNISLTYTDTITEDMVNKYRQLVINAGYEQAKEVWPSIEKMINLGK